MIKISNVLIATGRQHTDCETIQRIAEQADVQIYFGAKWNGMMMSVDTDDHDYWTLLIGLAGREGRGLSDRAEALRGRLISTFSELDDTGACIEWAEIELRE